MIIFASAHDEATRANHAVALRLRSPGDLFLGAEEATRDGLRGALEQRDEPLFAMSHGVANKLWAQGREASPPALVVEDDSLSKLGGRPVFAHACLTGRDLGRSASRSGSVWWGYDIKVNAPEDHPQLIDVFVGVFDLIKGSFASARAEGEQDELFRTLSERCDEALAKLDELYDQGAVDVPFSAHQCLLQIRDDLLVWVPGNDEPRFAPHVRGKRQVHL